MSQALTGAQFKVTMPERFYTVEGVKLPGEYGNVQVTTTLFRSETQSELEKTGWLGSAPLITALFTALYDNKGVHGVEELRKLFADDFKIGVMTATRVTYQAEAPDLVTHGVGMLKPRTLEARLIGPNGYVNTNMSDLTQALFGNSDADKVCAVYEWVTGRRLYLLRLNKQPKKNKESALLLNIGRHMTRFARVFYTDFREGNISDMWPARGVRVAPPNSTGSSS